MCRIGWEKTSQRGHRWCCTPLPSCPPDTRPTDRLRPSTSVDRGGCTHAFIVTPTTGIAAAAVVGEAGARHVPCRRPRTQWTTKTVQCCWFAASRSHPSPWMCKHNRQNPRRRDSVCVGLDGKRQVSVPSMVLHAVAIVHLQTRGRQTDYGPQRPWTEGVAHTHSS